MRRKGKTAPGARRLRARLVWFRRVAMFGRPRLLLVANEVAAAVLLIAILGGLHAEGLFLAEANGVDAIGGDAQRNEILLHGAGATISESEVVFGGTALVAVAFDGDPLRRIVAEIFGSLAEGGAS